MTNIAGSRIAAVMLMAGLSSSKSWSDPPPLKKLSVPPNVLAALRERAALTATPLEVVGSNGQRTTAGDNAVVLTRGQYLAARVAKEPIVSQKGTALHVESPFQFVGPGAAGELLRLQPIVEVDQGGLRFQDGTTFGGSVLVGVNDLDRPDQLTPLSEIAVVEMTSDGARIQPRVVELRHTNVPYVPVTLASDAPPDPLSLFVRTSFAREPLEIKIPVHRPRITLTSPPIIDGLGLGTADIRVALSPDAGARPIEIRLMASQGTLSDGAVNLTRDHSASVKIRSARLGGATIVASGGVFQETTAKIEFTWPGWFFLAALAGGGLGAVIHPLLRNRQVSPLIRHVIAGVLVGFLVACVFLLNVNLTSVPIEFQSNELAVFAIAAIGALAAIPIVARLSGGAQKMLTG